MSSISHTSLIHKNEAELFSTNRSTSRSSGLCGVAVAAAAAVGLSAPMLAIGGLLMYSDFSDRETYRAAFESRLTAHGRLLGEPAKAVLPAQVAVHGRELFVSACATCHGPSGTGVEGLGKDLTQSWFVASMDDASLRDFLAVGRPANDRLNTTKVPMPPRGGRDDFTDADLNDIIVYVRGLQDPRRMPELPAYAPPPIAAGPVSDDEKAKALAAAGGDAELAEYIAHGTRVFAATCAACHGKDGKGLPNLGKDLTKSEFTKKLDDDALLAFIQRGRDPGDPLNTTKVGMPPKGGNPALSEDDILDVIAYVRSLQKQASAVP